MSENKITLSPIGYVRCSRQSADDDFWDAETAFIDLDPTQFGMESLLGLMEFSHLEVIFFMDQVTNETIQRGARHPRGNKNWPAVGIFAQRYKGRPNALGHTICRILNVEALTIHVAGLDAIHNSPVLDLKPWVKEFGPRGESYQPTWVSELMKNYWQPDQT